MPMYQWSGFRKYPFNYLFRNAGKYYSALSRPYLFCKQHALNFLLSQSSLKFSFEKEISLSIPLPITSSTANSGSIGSIPTRRFVEIAETWSNLKDKTSPNDSLGMKYSVPVGMASLERFAEFPLYSGFSINSYLLFILIVQNRNTTFIWQQVMGWRRIFINTWHNPI
jgi:hypothetical protein